MSNGNQQSTDELFFLASPHISHFPLTACLRSALPKTFIVHGDSKNNERQQHILIDFTAVMGAFGKKKSFDSKDEYAPWLKDSLDGRLLQALVRDGSVQDMTPGQVQHAYASFRKYKPSNFAANLRRTRKEAYVDTAKSKKFPGEYGNVVTRLKCSELLY